MASDVLSSENKYEEEHVHQVYNNIASHFSSTRFKPWPVVDDFLRSLPTGSIGLDVGCGNGKYLTVRDDVFIVASDRSSELIDFAKQHSPHSAIVADTLNLPHPLRTFDFAICIAVIHHLSTPQRRQAGIRAILAALRNTKCKQLGPDAGDAESNGQALIFVWALEQKTSRRGWDTGHEQDVLVPWVLKQDLPSNKKGKNNKNGQSQNNVQDVGSTDKTLLEEYDNDVKFRKAHNPDVGKTYQRYYHLYREGELEEDIVAAGGQVVRKGYDKDNWWAICEPNDERVKLL